MSLALYPSRVRSNEVLDGTSLPDAFHLTSCLSNHGTQRLLGVLATAIQSHAPAISKPTRAPMMVHINRSIRGCWLIASRRIVRTSAVDTSQPVAGPSSSAAGEEIHPSPISMLRS